MCVQKVDQHSLDDRSVRRIKGPVWIKLLRDLKWMCRRNPIDFALKISDKVEHYPLHFTLSPSPARHNESAGSSPATVSLSSTSGAPASFEFAGMDGLALPPQPESITR